MFCAFEGAARIVRLWGTGTIFEFGTPEYEKLISPENRRPGSRAAIVIDVHKVGSVSWIRGKGNCADKMLMSTRVVPCMYEYAYAVLWVRGAVL